MRHRLNYTARRKYLLCCSKKAQPQVAEACKTLKNEAFYTQLSVAGILLLQISAAFSIAEAVGTVKSHISEMEKGKRTTTIERFALICEHYKVSSDYLLGLSDDPGL